MSQPSRPPAWAFAPPDLTGKRVVVVGASGGVGEGVVRVLLSGGATVLATGRDEQRLDDLASRITADGSAVYRLRRAPLDALVGDLDATVTSLAERHGPFDGSC